MRWFWQKKRSVLSRADLRKLLFRAFNGWAGTVLDSEYRLLFDEKDFLRLCPRVREWSKDFDCNRQVAEVFGKIQGFSVGAAIVPWGDGSVNHALLVCVFEGGRIKLFDVNERKFYSTAGKILVLLWM